MLNRLSFFILVSLSASVSHAKCIAVYMSNASEELFHNALTEIQAKLATQGCAAENSYQLRDNGRSIEAIPDAHRIGTRSPGYFKRLHAAFLTAKPGDEIRIVTSGHGVGKFLIFYTDIVRSSGPDGTTTFGYSGPEDTPLDLPDIPNEPTVSKGRSNDTRHITAVLLERLLQGVDPSVRVRLLLDHCGAGAFLQNFRRPNSCGVSAAFSGDAVFYTHSQPNYTSALARNIGNETLISAHRMARGENHPHNMGYDSLQAFLAVEFQDHPAWTTMFENLTSTNDSTREETYTSMVSMMSAYCARCSESSDNVSEQALQLAQAPVSDFERQMRNELVGSLDISETVRRYRDVSSRVTAAEDALKSKLKSAYARKERLEAELERLRARDDNSSRKRRDSVLEEIDNLHYLDGESTPELNRLYNEKQNLKVALRSFIALRQGTPDQVKRMEDIWSCLHARF